MMEYGFKLVYPKVDELTAAGFGKVAHIPAIFDSEPGYARLPSRFLIDRALGVWDPSFRGASYRDKVGKTVVQIDSKHMKRVVKPGLLLKPWLERMPNIAGTRADRLIQAFGHDLQTVLSDISRADEVAKLIEPSKSLRSAWRSARSMPWPNGSSPVMRSDWANISRLSRCRVRTRRGY